MKPAQIAPGGPSDSRNGTTTELRHEGPCGTRERCWRPSCRAKFGDYATVERLRDGRVLSRCHGSEFSVLGMQERAA